MTLPIIGFIGITLLIILILFARMPIAFAMATMGFVGYIYISGFDTALFNLGLIPYSMIANFSLTVLPLFMLMSMVAVEAKLSSDIYRAAYTWLGQIRGGLAMATVIGCGGFAAISGDSVATASAMGKVAVPEMQKYKYDLKLATGCVAAGGTVGVLIPPSMGFILYGILTQESIGKLFLAGILPGVLEIFIYMSVIYLLCLQNPMLGPPAPKTTFKKKLADTKQLYPMVALFILVMGGMYSGFFTPSEAGAIGAFGTFVLGFGMRRLSRDGVITSLLETGKITGMVGLLIVGAMIFARFVTVSKLPFALVDMISAMDVNRYVILSGILLFYIFAGCFLDIAAAMVLTIPILFPLILHLGFDPIWYGVLMVRVLEVGIITPPVGINCFVLSGVTGVPIGTIYRGIIPFVLADLLIIILLTTFPQISLWIPYTMKG